MKLRPSAARSMHSSISDDLAPRKVWEVSLVKNTCVKMLRVQEAL